MRDEAIRRWCERLKTCTASVVLLRQLRDRRRHGQVDDYPHHPRSRNYRGLTNWPDLLLRFLSPYPERVHTTYEFRVETLRCRRAAATRSRWWKPPTPADRVACAQLEAFDGDVEITRVARAEGVSTAVRIPISRCGTEIVQRPWPTARRCGETSAARARVDTSLRAEGRRGDRDDRGGRPAESQILEAGTAGEKELLASHRRASPAAAGNIRGDGSPLGSIAVNPAARSDDGFVQCGVLPSQTRRIYAVARVLAVALNYSRARERRASPAAARATRDALFNSVGGLLVLGCASTRVPVQSRVPPLPCDRSVAAPRHRGRTATARRPACRIPRGLAQARLCRRRIASAACGTAVNNAGCSR